MTLETGTPSSTSERWPSIIERRVAKADFRARFWIRDPINPSPFLAGLRDIVLERSHTRCPRWKFKLDELILEIQPRPGERRDGYALFRCAAMQDGWRLGFLIEPCTAGGWQYHPRSVRWPRPDYPGCLALRDRVLAALRSGRLDRFDPALMFGAYCLCCGKALTDPASMARWIGPECAGTSSLDAGLITPRGAVAAPAIS
jgi:hypothetical protein